MDKLPELLPCPFCGGHPSTFPNDDDNGWWVGCDDCDAEISRSEVDNARAAWNTRSTPPKTEPTDGDGETYGEWRKRIRSQLATSDARIAELEAAMQHIQNDAKSGKLLNGTQMCHRIGRIAHRALKSEGEG